MGIAARLVDNDSSMTRSESEEVVDLRVAPTWGGAIEFSLGNNHNYERLVIAHANLQDVLDFCESVKTLALELQAIKDPK